MLRNETKRINNIDNIKVLRYNYKQMNSLRDILYFVLKYVRIKYKISNCVWTIDFLIICAA